jgi:asparagine synthase (glutamine-hydrolysing)
MTIHEGGKTTTSNWWNLKKEIQNQPEIKNPIEWFRETFDDAVKTRMVSDVPVGVMLSGGLDSSSILASLHHQKYKDIQSFNIGFKEKEHNEAHLAQLWISNDAIKRSKSLSTVNKLDLFSR